MLISREWLQSYFETPLPSPNELVELLGTKSFEPEGAEEKEGTTVMDFDVLPNRAHDCLCHRGFAREVSALLDTPLKESTATSPETQHTITKSIQRDPETDCTLYTTRIINNVSVHESPTWLQKRLASIGQRSINNIVDATNYVMFDIGQPIHAFDADHVHGPIQVRHATKGEAMETLDSQHAELAETDVVIADDNGVLAIAGVKGGNRAGVTEATTDIILEVAHFYPSRVRKTARRIPLLTDSSKRFENETSDTLVAEAMKAVTRLVLEIASTDATSIGPVNTSGEEAPTPQAITLAKEKIANMLGVSISEEHITCILKRIGCVVHNQESHFLVTPPPWRLDLVIPEDLVEEIGRIHGYENIPDELPPTSKNIHIDTMYWYEHRIKNILAENGFDEVHTYSFVEDGAVAMKNKIAEDKGYLRTTLSKQCNQALAKNARNAVLLGKNSIKMFEIGSVHPSAEHEQRHLYLAWDPIAKKQRSAGTTVQLQDVLSAIDSELGTALASNITHDGDLFFEINLNSALENAPKPDSYASLVRTPSESSATYHPFSIFPHIARDIALWADTHTTPEDIQKILTEQEGEFLIRADLFDTFTNGERTSYAFRLVFQSHHKTLSDEEIEPVMQAIGQAIDEKGWEIR